MSWFGLGVGGLKDNGLVTVRSNHGWDMFLYVSSIAIYYYMDVAADIHMLC